MFLFCTANFSPSRDAQSQHIAIKLQTCLSVTDDDRGVIDTEKESIFSLPFRIALPFGKLQDLKPMLVRIAKVERFDTASVLVPIRQALRSSRSMLYLVLPQQR